MGVKTGFTDLDYILDGGLQKGCAHFHMPFICCS